MKIFSGRNAVAEMVVDRKEQFTKAAAVLVILNTAHRCVYGDGLKLGKLGWCGE